MKNKTIIVYGLKNKKEKNIIYVREEDFEISHGEDYKIAIELLHIVEKTLIFNKSIKQHLLYHDISLWWLIYQSIIPELKKTINFTKKFIDLINEENPSRIVINNDYNRICLIKKICIQKGIDLQYSTPRYFFKKIKSFVKLSLQKSRYKKITSQKIRRRKKIFYDHKSELISTKDKILFAISTNFRRSVFNHTEKEFSRGEYIQQPIIDMLDKSEVIGIDLDYTFTGQDEVLQERINDEIYWFPIEILLKNKIDIKKKEFLNYYEKLISKEEFQNLFQYYGVSLWEELGFHFKKMTFLPYLPFYLLLLDSLFTYFSQNKPKILFIPYETGSIALALISVMNRIGVKTIGIQHGFIYPHSPMYSQIDFAEKNNPYGYPLPDHTLLFGEYTKNLLVSCGYPTEKLIVFGNPAFFKFEKSISSLNSNKYKKKYGIKNDTNILLFTTGKLQRAYVSHGKYDYDEKILEILLNKFANDKNFFIIIKPHPTETNIEIYKEIMRRFSPKNVIIEKENLFELINLSSIVISVFSTTMLDSLCFKKNIIRVSAGKEFNPIFDDSGVVLVSDLQNLYLNIMKIISKSHSVSEVEISNFVKMHYGIPEQNSETLIKELLNSAQ